jgi:hypothetical protein
MGNRNYGFEGNLKGRDGMGAETVGLKETSKEGTAWGQKLCRCEENFKERDDMGTETVV